MITLYIVLIVLASLITLYFLGFAIVFVLFSFFRSELQKYDRGLNINLAQQFDTLTLLEEYLANYGYHHQNNGANLASEMQEMIKTDMSNEIRKVINHNFGEIRKSHYKFIRDAKIDENEVYYVSLKKSMSDLQNQYRILIAQYNAGVLGYNYWRRFILYRYMFARTTKSQELI